MVGNDSRSIIIVGGGGHAAVCLDLLRKRNKRVLGYLAPFESEKLKGKLPYLGPDDELLSYSPNEILLTMGIGFTHESDLRERLFRKLQIQGYRFATLCHEAAILAGDVKIEEGAQIMAGAIIQANTSIGANVLVNTKVSIDHDARIESHVAVMPGTTVCGGVVIGESSYIGAGSTIIQNIKIGERSVIGAGSLVIRHVAPDSFVFGSPAKERMRK